jgi:Tfp pilus assembly protein PilO
MKIGLRELTFFALLIAIPVAAYAFVFMPHGKTVKSLQEETQKKMGRLAQLQRLGHASKSLSRELEELRKAMEFFESKLPDSQQIDNVLTEVTLIAEKNQLVKRSWESQKIVQSADYVARPVEMKLAGNFAGVYEFLRGLERLPRITRIRHMEIRSDDEGGPGAVEVLLQILIYFEPNQTKSVTSGDDGSRSSGRQSGPAARRRF